jgi:hypothetical protein
MRATVRACVVAPLIVMLAACGGTAATEPTPPVTASGTWTGNLESTNFGQQGVTLTLTQTGNAVGGTWATPALNMSGSVSGTLTSGAFSGSLTLATPSATGGTCSGTASVTGSVAATNLTWSGQGFTGSCGGLPLGIRFVAERKP